MKKIFTKEWFEAAGIRAIRTFAQAFIATIGTTAVTMGQVPWLTVVSASMLSAILSFATSVASLPELDKE